MVCDLGGGAFESPSAGAITWPRGDSNGNNEVNVIDIVRTVDVVKAILSDDLVVVGSNVWTCSLDDIVNALDIAEVVNAVKASPSPCATPCP
jgi:hypothetical protein